MKDIFRNCVMGVLLLAAVLTVSLYMGQMDQDTKASSDEGMWTKGFWRLFSAKEDKVKETDREGKWAVVVLDAGHGGMDPGKVGVDGQLEKDINLKIVKKIKVYLEANDIAVILTRENNEGLYGSSDQNKKSADMKRRIQIINDARADAMVSIHQNSYHQPEISGAQVFYYQNSEEGKQFAQIVQKRFDYCLGEKNRRQAKANGSYYLLSRSKPVSIIVEGGFLSNPKEAALLETEEYQDKIAWTVAVGVMQYLNDSKAKK